VSGPLLEWNDEFLIGVEELDYEHRDLFARVNEIHEELGRPSEKARVEDCLGELYARLEAHFALEEKFMRETDFPHFDEHKKEHDSFLDGMIEAVEAFRNRADLGPTEALLAEVKHWVIDHIVTSDKEMGRPRRRRRRSLIRR